RAQSTRDRQHDRVHRAAAENDGGRRLRHKNGCARYSRKRGLVTSAMDLLLIGGPSGSGKSVALAAVEDSGYYTVNNLPLPLLAQTATYLQRAGQVRVAVGLDVKTEPGLAALPAAIDELRAMGCSVRFL